MKIDGFDGDDHYGSDAFPSPGFSTLNLHAEHSDRSYLKQAGEHLEK